MFLTNQNAEIVACILLEQKCIRHLVGAGKSLNGREAKNAKKRLAVLRVLDFSSPEFFSRLFRPFPPPLSAPGSPRMGKMLLVITVLSYYSST